MIGWLAVKPTCRPLHDALTYVGGRPVDTRRRHHPIDPACTRASRVAFVPQKRPCLCIHSSRGEAHRWAPCGWRERAVKPAAGTIKYLPCVASNTRGGLCGRPAPQRRAISKDLDRRVSAGVPDRLESLLPDCPLATLTHLARRSTRTRSIDLTLNDWTC